MKVVFLGVGEAADENYPCNSHLILSNTNILLDCGYSIPPQIWKYNNDKDFIDTIFISHLHSDHYFGLPVLLIRMMEENRTKPITIICKGEFVKQIKKIIDLGYKGCRKGFTFPLNFIEIEPGESIVLNESKMSFAITLHTVPNMAVRIENKVHSICYSGDGCITNDSSELYKNCDLLIHESYKLHGPIKYHSTIDEVIENSENNNVGCLVLTHIQRSVRSEKSDVIDQMIKKSKIPVILPNPMDTFCLESKRFIRKH